MRVYNEYYPQKAEENVMNKQMPEKDKIKIADFVIFNNDGMDELQAETENVIRQIEKLNE